MQDWCTGVTIVDINNDGYQDIFISKSGWFEGDQESKLSNLLFVNNKDLTFTEKSKDYGFNDLSRSNQACFFDMDNDGDLDMYLLTQIVTNCIKTIMVNTLTLQKKLV